jgi:hypothetical protein
MVPPSSRDRPVGRVPISIPVTSFKRLAEIVGEYCAKGSRIGSFLPHDPFGHAPEILQQLAGRCVHAGRPFQTAFALFRMTASIFSMIVHVPYEFVKSFDSVCTAGMMAADMSFNVFKTRLGLIATKSPNFSQCFR